MPHQIPSSNNDPVEPVAIIGMACRLPGSINNPSSLWETILSKRSTYSPVPASRFTHTSFYHSDGSRPGSLNIPGGNFISSSIAEFDATFFGISPVDAYVMDPQQRMLCEVAYECIESAGVTLDSLKGNNVGVYVGAWTSDYENIQTKDPTSKEAEAGWITGTGRAILSNRISYLFDLKGPSMTIDTGCSASAMALHIACQALQTPSSRTNSALVGGTNLMINPEMPISMTKLGILSPTGGCATFDERANGYSRADGINCIYIKRLSDALRDGDPIRAIIRASAANSDGKTIGLTAPSATSQEAVIREAYLSAGISDFTQTAYYECHGTGTKVGDPIEASAIGKVFGRSRHADDPLYVGGVKTNIGHSEASSGISAIIKTVLAVESGVIPPNVGFCKPNPKIKFKNWKLKVPTESMAWPTNRAIRRASVGAFGYGGANAHFIIEDIESYMNSARYIQPPCQMVKRRKGFLRSNKSEQSTQNMRPHLLIFSAKTAGCVKESIDRLAASLGEESIRDSKANLADLAYTLSQRRSLLPVKAYGVFSGITNAEVSEELKRLSEGLECFPEAVEERRLGFVFTGQGAQFAQMGVGLISAFPLVARTLELLDSHLKGLDWGPEWDIIAELKRPRDETNINDPEFSQTLCTAIQICIVVLLRSWGIFPRAVIGHSSGEIAAAFSSGSLTMAEAITVAYYRGITCSRAISDPGFPKGGMHVISLGEEAIGKYLEPHMGKIGVACVNSPNCVTISGDLDALELLSDELHDARDANGKSVFYKRLPVPLAYHSHHMKLLGSSYEEQIGAITPRVGHCPMFSSVTGTIIDGRRLVAAYWRENLESTVLFSDAVQSLVASGACVNTLLEISPQKGMATPLREIREALGLPLEALAHSPTLLRRKDAAQAMLEVAGTLFGHGCGALDLEMVNAIEESFDNTTGEVVYETRRVLVDLPSYPWDHSQEYWLECRRSKEWRFRKHPRHDILGTRIPGTDPCEPQWTNALSVSNAPWLQDHVIRGNIVFPATGYICMAVEALTQYLESMDQFDPQQAYTLREISIQKPLVLGDERSKSESAQGPSRGTDIALTLKVAESEAADASKWYRFNIRSTTGGGKETTKHCSGLITMDKLRNKVGPPFPSKDHVREIHSRQFYEVLNEVGFHYGPTFAGLRNIRAQTERQEMWAEMDNVTKTGIESILGGDGSKTDPLPIDENAEKEVLNDTDEDSISVGTPSIGSGSLTPTTSVSSISADAKQDGASLQKTDQLDIDHITQNAPDERLESAESAAEDIRRLHLFKAPDQHVDSRAAVHPANLDQTLQLLFGALHSGRISAITDIMVPVFIEEIYIGTPSPETKTFSMHAVLIGDQRHSTAYDASGLEVVRVTNIEARELGQFTGRGRTRQPNIMRLNWVADFDGITQNNYRKAMNTVRGILQEPPPPGAEEEQDLEDLIKYMAADMIEMTEGLIPINSHLEKYRSWLIEFTRGEHKTPEDNLSEIIDKTELENNTSPLTDPLARKIEIERLISKGGVRAELVQAVHSNIIPLFLGEIDVDRLFNASNIWTRFNAAEDIMQCVTSLSRLYSSTHSKANILEIGAGSGCGTHAILKGCTEKAGTPSMEKRYNTYTFTDCNSDFVAEGKEAFGAGYSGMEFSTLDIEKDPEFQGFERKYDIVHAVNVLHETRNLRESARNISKLLKIGGKIHITDFISPGKSAAEKKYVPFAFGISESWWRAEEEYRARNPLITIQDWIAVLQTTGFRVDFTVSDAEISSIYACLVGTYIGDQRMSIPPAIKAQDQLDTRPLVVVLYRDTITPKVENITTILTKSIRTHQIITISFAPTALEFPENTSFVLSLLELEHPLLAGISEPDFSKFKCLMSSSIPILWITTRVHLIPENPKCGLINGFVRTLRNETGTSKYNLLDLSSKGSTEISQQISSVLKMIVAREVEDSLEGTSKSRPDWEYAEYQGLRYVPRVIVDDEITAAYTPQADQQNLGEPYSQNTKTLGVMCSKRGMLVSPVIFEEKAVVGSEIPDDHVEICPDVFGLTPEDVSAAFENSPLATLGIACSGIINKIGSAVEDFSIGDRVCTFSPNEFKNRFSVSAAMCCHRPEGVDPVDFTGSLIAHATAVRAVLHVARTEPEEKILIHQATSGIGLAAIQICKYLGVTIFATCGGTEESEYLTATQQIPPTNIFSSNDSSFREEVMKATHGEGVDVILNTLVGDLLRESWKCLAPFGRFIDVGKRNVINSRKLDIAGFVKNTSYAAVDITGFSSGGNKLLGRLLKDVMELYTEDVIRPIDRITRFSISEIEEAFKYSVEEGSSIGSIALTVNHNPTVEELVKVAQQPHEIEFDPQATYLLIGGLGGIGCSLAVWMAEKGAKHFTFMTRSGVRTEEAKQALVDIAAFGCGYDVLQCDVGNFGEVAAAMDTISRPLGGLIHAAMVLRDGIFENMEHADFVLPLHPKVNGLLNLEKILENPKYNDLQFLVVLSSISGVLGTPGQSNYATANAFEDSFIRSRQHRGLPGCSLDLGMITNVGYISQNPEIERKLIQQAGIGSCNERQLQWLFRIALDTPILESTSGISQLQDFSKSQIVTGVDIHPGDVRRVQETTWFQDPKWRIIDSIVTSRVGNSNGMGEGMMNDENALNARLLDQLKDVETRQAEDVIGDIAQCIIWKTAVMTMIPAADISAEHSLFRYGMDSLGAVEMRNWFLRVTEVELKVEDVLKAVSIRNLGERMYNGYKSKKGAS